jgi:xanthosine utilization system XapX-like protein
MRYLWISVGALAVLTLMVAGGIFTSAWTAVLYSDIAPQRAQVLGEAMQYIVRGFFVVTVLCIITVGAVWAHRSGRLPAVALISLLGVLIGLDLMRVDAPFIQTMDFARIASPDPNVQVLLDRQAEEDPFRVLSLGGGVGFGQDVTPGQFGLELAGGHHPNDLARYRELIGMVGSGLPTNLIFSTNVLSILNVRYLIWPVALGAPEDQALPPTTLENLQPISQTTLRGQPYETVYSFTALPRARLVAEVVVLPDEETVPFILSEDFEPATQVVLSEAPATALVAGPVDGEVEWISRGLNEQELRVRSDRPSLLVIADNWFPAWHARVNGEEEPVLRANHTLRAIPVPAGESTVELYYASGQLSTGLWVTVLSLLTVLGVASVSYVRGRHPPREGVA